MKVFYFEQCQTGHEGYGAKEHLMFYTSQCFWVFFNVVKLAAIGLKVALLKSRKCCL